MSVMSRIMSVMSSVLPEETLGRATITEDTRFVEDLGLDSLDLVEFVMGMEEETGLEVPDEISETMNTVGDGVKFLEEKGVT